jgi:hypothetical protein
VQPLARGGVEAEPFVAGGGAEGLFTLAAGWRGG